MNKLKEIQILLLKYKIELYEFNKQELRKNNKHIDNDIKSYKKALHNLKENG